MTLPLDQVNINSQPIELCKLLKITNFVSGGGEAKILITEGYVKVNDQLEYQKRKKIVSGDIIELNGDKILVVYQPNAEKKRPKNEQKLTKEKKHKNKITNQNIQQSTPSIKSAKKRKPISF